MSEGKLYRSGEDQFVVDIDYRVLESISSGFSGEFVPAKAHDIADNDEYVIELEDSNRIRCRLRKNVNRPVFGLPPRFVYSFTRY